MIRLREWKTEVPERLADLRTRCRLFAATNTGRPVPVSIVEGRTRVGDRPARMLVAGNPRWTRYLPERFFGGTPEWRSIGRFPIWNLKRVIESHAASADLTVIRVDRWSARLWMTDPSYLEVPEWVGTRIRVPADLEPLLNSGRSIKSDMSLVRRNGFESSLDLNGETFEQFYDDVYLAYRRSRFGSSPYGRSREDLLGRLPRGGILWAHLGGERVAGVFFEHKGDELSLLALGTLHGDLDLVKRGAGAALYYFLMQLAQAAGRTTVDLRGCRPSLLDGVLRYKQKWGAVIGENPPTHFDWLVRWNRPSSVVTTFLAHTPLIFRDKGGFSAVTGDDIECARSLGLEGIQEMYRLTSSGWDRLNASDPTVAND